MPPAWISWCEMRTPVASIEGYLGLALNPATAHIDEKARDFITKAHKSARHLGKLFQDLLDISKSEDGRLKNELKVIDVNEFVKEIFDGLAQKAAEKKLDYIFNPAVKINDDGSEKSLQPIFYANVDPDHFREVESRLNRRFIFSSGCSYQTASGRRNNIHAWQV